MATVKIPPVLRAQTDGAAEVSAGGATVGEVLSGLAEAHPGTRTQLFSAEGDLNRYVNVYLNDEDVRVLDGLDTPASEADTVVILPAMAGGALRTAGKAGDERRQRGEAPGRVSWPARSMSGGGEAGAMRPLR